MNCAPTVTPEPLFPDTPAPATRILRDAKADPLDGQPILISLPVGRGHRIGIAGHRRAANATPASPSTGPKPRPEYALGNPQAFARPHVRDWWDASAPYLFIAASWAVLLGGWCDGCAHTSSAGTPSGVPRREPIMCE